MRKVNSIFAVILALAFVVGCEKGSDPEPTRLPEKLVVNPTLDSEKESNYFDLNITLLNEEKGKGEVASFMNRGSSSGSMDTPLDLNQDSVFDIRYGYHAFVVWDILIYKSFYLTNNYNDKFEFATKAGSYIAYNGENLNVLEIFDENSTIDSTLRWLSSSDNDVFAISYYYHYDFNQDIADVLNEFGYSNESFYLNQDIEGKYIAIRTRKESDYVYGWIKISVDDYSKLEMKECYFTSQF